LLLFICTTLQRSRGAEAQRGIEKWSRGEEVR